MKHVGAQSNQKDVATQDQLAALQPRNYAALTTRVIDGTEAVALSGSLKTTTLDISKLHAVKNGFGGVAIPGVTDCNTTQNIDYVFNASSSGATANRPFNTGDWIVQQGCTAANYKTQTATRIDRFDVCYRNMNGGVWSAWGRMAMAQRPVVQLPSAGGTADFAVSSEFFISMQGNATITLAGLPSGSYQAAEMTIHVECHSGQLTFAGYIWLNQEGGFKQPVAGKNTVYKIRAHPSAAGYAAVLAYGVFG